MPTRDAHPPDPEAPDSPGEGAPPGFALADLDEAVAAGLDRLRPLLTAGELHVIRALQACAAPARALWARMFSRTPRPLALQDLVYAEVGPPSPAAAELVAHGLATSGPFRMDELLGLHTLPALLELSRALGAAARGPRAAVEGALRAHPAARPALERPAIALRHRSLVQRLVRAHLIGHEEGLRALVLDRLGHRRLPDHPITPGALYPHRRAMLAHEAAARLWGGGLPSPAGGRARRGPGPPRRARRVGRAPSVPVQRAAHGDPRRRRGRAGVGAGGPRGRRAGAVRRADPVRGASRGGRRGRAGAPGRDVPRRAGANGRRGPPMRRGARARAAGRRPRAGPHGAAPRPPQPLALDSAPTAAGSTQPHAHPRPGAPGRSAAAVGQPGGARGGRGRRGGGDLRGGTVGPPLRERAVDHALRAPAPRRDLRAGARDALRAGPRAPARPRRGWLRCPPRRRPPRGAAADHRR